MFPIPQQDVFTHGDDGIAALLKTVDEADVFIGIYGMRYGRILDGQTISATEWEFNRAVERGIPILLFLIHENHPVTRAMVERDERANEKLAAFVERAGEGRIFHRFKSPEDLRGQVIEALASLPEHVVSDGKSSSFKSDVSRVDKYAPETLIGREEEVKMINDSWSQVARGEKKRPHVLTFVALGGEGKTSLVANWIADLAHRDWPGCDAAFAWSFYSQGTREQLAASSDLFLKEALIFFGEPALASSAQSSSDKGRRLAQLIGERKVLLFLDGLEPLQYAPTSPTAGEVRDAGLAALLKGLAAESKGLCILTTRYSISNLKAFWQTTAPEVKLRRLSREAGVHLLKMLGVKGNANELETLVEDVKGHALTLNLLGTYLRDAHGGDIRKRDLVKIAEADFEEQGGHAFHVMDTYVKSIQTEQTQNCERALAIFAFTLGSTDPRLLTASMHCGITM